MAIEDEQIVLDENRIGRAERDRSVPACDRAVDRHAISQIGGPVVDELIVVDDSHLFAGHRAGIALKFDSGAQELREASVEDLEVLRRALDVEAPIGDGGDGRRSIALCKASSLPCSVMSENLKGIPVLASTMIMGTLVLSLLTRKVLSRPAPLM